MFFDFQDKNKPFGNQFGLWKEEKSAETKSLFGADTKKPDFCDDDEVEILNTTLLPYLDKKS